MPKQIVILCDGTNHNKDRGHISHIACLYDMLSDLPEDQRPEVLYIPGVGSNIVMGTLNRLLELALGNIFGVGLNRDIKRAYGFLCQRYQPGDQVYLFGWSRGSYIARSLIGLVRNTGLFDGDTTPRAVRRKARAALRHYRSRAYDTRPWSEGSLAFRALFSPRFVTSSKENAWRQLHGIAPGQRFQFAYAGILDTVGVRGLRGVIGQVILSRVKWIKTPFHDNQLSSTTASARHAVALDERSRILPSTLWDRDLRHEDGVGRDGLPLYAQEFFPGSHGIVGGRDQANGLAAETLRWVLEGAAQQGLTLPEDALLPVANEAILAAPVELVAKSRLRRAWDRFAIGVFGRNRRPVEDYRNVSNAAWVRVWGLRNDPVPYQPFMLRGVWRSLWRDRAGDQVAVPPISPFSK